MCVRATDVHIWDEGGDGGGEEDEEDNIVDEGHHGMACVLECANCAALSVHVELCAIQRWPTNVAAQHTGTLATGERRCACTLRNRCLGFV